MKGIVIKSTGSWYRIKSGLDYFEARLKGRFKLEDKKITNPIAVGDIVEIDLNPGTENEWMISAIEARKNYIIRKSPRKKHHDHLLASNLDQAIMVATLKMPRTSFGFIDRFLVTLEAYRIPGVLFFNKMDLLDKQELESVGFIAKKYREIGYQCVMGSVLNEDLGKLTELMEGRVSLLAGHSGSGKSSLINYLLPEVQQKVADISDFANKGVHTTTFAEMFFTDTDTAIIDTPGIKELGLAEIQGEELGHYFPEFREKLGQCKFNNCLHVEEPGCAIRKGLEAGEIFPERYISYLSMLGNEDNRR